MDPLQVVVVPIGPLIATISRGRGASPAFSGSGSQLQPASRPSQTGRSAAALPALLPGAVDAAGGCTHMTRRCSYGSTSARRARSCSGCCGCGLARRRGSGFTRRRPAPPRSPIALSGWGIWEEWWLATLAMALFATIAMARAAPPPGALLSRRRAARALAVVGVEEALAQADRFRRHLDQLVVLDIGDRLFEASSASAGSAAPPRPWTVVRMLVSCLPLTGLTSRSLPRLWAPMIMPCVDLRAGRRRTSARAPRGSTAHRRPRRRRRSRPGRRCAGPRSAPCSGA